MQTVINLIWNEGYITHYKCFLKTSNKIIIFKEMRMKKKRADVVFGKIIDWWGGRRETGKNSIYRKSTVNKYQKTAVK